MCGYFITQRIYRATKDRNNGWWMSTRSCSVFFFWCSLLWRMEKNRFLVDNLRRDNRTNMHACSLYGNIHYIWVHSQHAVLGMHVLSHIVSNRTKTRKRRAILDDVCVINLKRQRMYLGEWVSYNDNCYCSYTQMYDIWWQH